jgi:two-component system, NarL family, invasion response regulator UvrY
VDDSVDILAAFERLLRGALPDVVVGAALNGVAALELFTQHVWDVVVLDFSMPGESGLVVLEKLMAHLPSVAVVMLSTRISRKAVEHCFRQGALGFVAKEETPGELVPAINTVLKRRHYHSKAVAR